MNPEDLERMVGSTIAQRLRQYRQDSSLTIAQLAAKGALETLKLTDFDDVFTTYNTSDVDDPGGPAMGEGPGFDVGGLAPLGGDADGMVCRYVFPNDPADAAEILCEDIDDRVFGMPRDLTGEGDVEGLITRPTTGSSPWRR